MRTYSIHPAMIFHSLWQHRNIVWQMTKRDVVGRYRGSFMGLMWSFLNPLFMLIIYTIVFGFIFKNKWSDGNTQVLEFSTILFAGLIVFNFFAECISRSPNLVLNNVSFVKKIVFPLEILPWVTLGASLFHASLSLLVLLVFHFFIHPSLPSWTILFLPLVFLPLILFTLGVSWFLAALGVYVRDVTQTISIIIPALMFLSPIFYPMSAVPKGFYLVAYLNPLSFIIEQTRSVLLWGQVPQFMGLGVYFLVSGVISWLGFSWFQKTRNGFADVI
jgi:lipopolysaccharide transport system permease protein